MKIKTVIHYISVAIGTAMIKNRQIMTILLMPCKGAHRLAFACAVPKSKGVFAGYFYLGERV
jgi:hypothetical protein